MQFLRGCELVREGDVLGGIVILILAPKLGVLSRGPRIDFAQSSRDRDPPNTLVEAFEVNFDLG